MLRRMDFPVSCACYSLIWVCFIIADCRKFVKVLLQLPHGICRMAQKVQDSSVELIQFVRELTEYSAKKSRPFGRQHRAGDSRNPCILGFRDHFQNIRQRSCTAVYLRKQGECSHVELSGSPGSRLLLLQWEAILYKLPALLLYHREINLSREN